MIYEYSPRRLIRSYFGADGGPRATRRHYYLGGDIHQEVFGLDAQGRKVSLVFFDPSGRRVATGLGSYALSFERIDPKTFVQTQRKADGSNNVLTQYFPFGRARIQVDERGHLSSIENLDPAGQLVDAKEGGFARVVFDFDEFGNELGWKFFSAAGSPVDRQPYGDLDHGYSAWVTEFEWTERALGRYSSFREYYLDSEGKPVANNFGVHSVRVAFNRFGDVTSVAHFDVAGAPVAHAGVGYHRQEIDYDEDGRRTATRAFGVDGALVGDGSK